MERVVAKPEQIFVRYSLHDLDFGYTDHVKHHIHLHGDTPFKHQGRPIRPCDIEAVRNNLQDVLVPGVMQEYESPLAISNCGDENPKQTVIS